MRNGQKSRRGGYKLSYKELEVYKHFNGFDPRYLGHNLYLPLVARRLNNYHYSKIFEDKKLLDHFSSEITAPIYLVRCIDGEYYNRGFEQISKNEARRICLDYEGSMIIKPSRESSGGQNVKKFTSEERKKSNWFDRISKSYGNDWLAQECIKQHESLAYFHSESINTFRITTLYLNGRASVCSSVFRFEDQDSVTDNWGGAGGKIVGVHNDGRLHDFAINNKLERFEGINHKKYAEMTLSHIPMIHELVLRAHVRVFSLCKLIGWDVCMDQDEKPVIIEINSSQTGIFAEQVCTGPIFGDRTEEVIDYVSKKEFKYGRGLLKI